MTGYLQCEKLKMTILCNVSLNQYIMILLDNNFDVIGIYYLASNTAFDVIFIGQYGVVCYQCQPLHDSSAAFGVDAKTDVITQNCSISSLVNNEAPLLPLPLRNMEMTLNFWSMSECVCPTGSLLMTTSMQTPICTNQAK